MAHDEHQPGDKVLLRDGQFAGCRGILRGDEGNLLRVELPSGEMAMVASDAFTNYSLAARRAWKSMPKRAGRPPAAHRKKMASFRLDVDVLHMLAKAVEYGLVPSREHAVNEWLRNMLKQLLTDHQRQSTHRQVPTTNIETLP